MKKLLFSIALVTTAFLTGCNSCTQMTKNIESNIGDLDRDVVVLSAFSGDTLFKYSGPCYISESNNTSNSVTLIYYVGRSAKKADWIGAGFIFQAIEK